MQIRLRNVLAVGALTSGLLAGGALVANAATTSTTTGNSGSSSSSSPPTHPRRARTPGAAAPGTPGRALRTPRPAPAPVRRLHQELPQHGQRIDIRHRQDASVGIRRPARRSSASLRLEQRVHVRLVIPRSETVTTTGDGRRGPEHLAARPPSSRPPGRATEGSRPSPPGHRVRTPPAHPTHRRCAPPPRRAPAGGGGRPAGRSRPARGTRRR